MLLNTGMAPNVKLATNSFREKILFLTGPRLLVNFLALPLQLVKIPEINTFSSQVATVDFTLVERALYSKLHQ